MFSKCRWSVEVLAQPSVQALQMVASERCRTSRAAESSSPPPQLQPKEAVAMVTRAVYFWDGLYVCMSALVNDLCFRHEPVLNKYSVEK